jgi:hypothetical protein
MVPFHFLRRQRLHEVAHERHTIAAGSSVVHSDTTSSIESVAGATGRWILGAVRPGPTAVLMDLEAISAIARLRVVRNDRGAAEAFSQADFVWHEDPHDSGCLPCRCTVTAIVPASMSRIGKRKRLRYRERLRYSRTSWSCGTAGGEVGPVLFVKRHSRRREKSLESFRVVALQCVEGSGERMLD